MIKDIKYSGYSAVPSDYECPDGSLAESMNLINDDGTMKTIMQPSVVLGLPNGSKVVYIHETASYTHYIGQTGTKFFWFNLPSSGETLSTTDLYTFPTRGEIYQVHAIGNTLLILTDDGIYYFLWKGDDNGYISLGTHLPEVQLSFGLQTEVVRTAASENFDLTGCYETIDNDWNGEFTDDAKTTISNVVLAKINKFIEDEATSKGKFIFPFFVRYAYRLFDGSLTMHSAPVLMLASTNIAPRCAIDPDKGSTFSLPDKYIKNLFVYGPVSQLDYQTVFIENSVVDPYEELKNWSDIIRSVDVFISAPLYLYDQSGKCKKLRKVTYANREKHESFVCCKLVSSTNTSDPGYYQMWYLSDMFAETFNPNKIMADDDGYGVRYMPIYDISLPEKDDETFAAAVRDCSQFYFLKSIKLDDLAVDEREIINVPDDYLSSLVAREVMTDDYDSHDTLIPQFAHSYNQRINLANIKKTLFQGFGITSSIPYTNGYYRVFLNKQVTGSQYNSSTDVTWYNVNNMSTFRTYFFIRQDNKEIIVRAPDGTMCLAGGYMPLFFLYYPNINAYKVRVQYDSGKGYELNLEQHDFLNGVFFFQGWTPPDIQTGLGGYPTVSADQSVELSSKIYTSEVNNPFFFPVTNINTVGTGTILGISSAAKALSQGQFGQFPLYAFTSEGVWALEVSSTGTFSARQPITRDVCINSDSITQLDSSVLFATDRGIMLISGSNTQCITDTINSETPFDVLNLPGMDRLHTLLDHSGDSCLPIVSFSEFMKQCGIIYDYVNQHIIIYNPSINYAYVFSMKTKEWGMMYSNIASGINSYPEALAVDNDCNLLNFAVSSDELPKGMLVTRPIKLETPDVLKTIDTVIQRGFFQKGHVQSVLYGSRDLYHWHLVWSSKDHYLRGFRGTPYKYFRIACVTSLSEGESIFGASLQFNPRHTDQPR